MIESVGVNALKFHIPPEQIYYMYIHVPIPFPPSHPQ